MRSLLLLLGLLAILGPAERASAQPFELSREAPSTWHVRRDAGAGGDDIRLRATGDGLMAQTGASSILYRPDLELSGPYRIEIDLTLFDPQRRNEGFGLILGGRVLASPERSYDYVLLRQDGHTLIKRRRGSETRVLRDWAHSTAVRTWADRPQGADHVTNTLVLVVRQEEIRLEVNGETVERLPPDRLETEGRIGLRINHGVSLRVERFTIIRGP